MQELNKHASQMQEKIDAANTVMSKMKLPGELRKKVIDFIIFTESNLGAQQEMDIFQQMVPPSLKEQMVNHMFYKVITKNPIIKGSEALTEKVLSHLETVMFTPEKLIIKQGTGGEGAYFIYLGICEVIVFNPLHNCDYSVKQLHPGAFVGEVALLFGCKRTATIKCLNYSTCAYLKKESFLEILGKSEQQQFREAAVKYNDNWSRLQRDLLRTHFAFNDLSAKTLQMIAYVSKMQHLQSGTLLIQQGEEVEGLYFVIDG